MTWMAQPADQYQAPRGCVARRHPGRPQCPHRVPEPGRGAAVRGRLHRRRSRQVTVRRAPRRQPRRHPRADRSGGCEARRCRPSKRRSCGSTAASPTWRSTRRCSTSGDGGCDSGDRPRHRRAEAARSGPARKRGAAHARVRRRPGRRVGLERRDAARSSIRRDGSRCSATRTTRSPPTVTAWETAAASRRPFARRGVERRGHDAGGRPTKASSGCATRTVTTSPFSRAGLPIRREADGRGRPHRRHASRHHRKQADRIGPARERGAADARVRRRAGRRLGLEPRDRRGGLLVALEADARLRRRRDRAAHQRVGAARPPGRSGPGRPGARERRRAASRPTRPSSGSGTRTAITSRSCRAGFRSAASPAGRSSGSSAPTSISPSAGSGRPSMPAPSCWRTSCSSRKTSGGASPATCTTSSASS